MPNDQNEKGATIEKQKKRIRMLKEKDATIEKQKKRIRMLNDQNDDLMNFEDRYKPDPQKTARPLSVQRSGRIGKQYCRTACNDIRARSQLFEPAVEGLE